MAEESLKVVALNDQVILPGSISEGVVLALEQLLASARSGEVVAVAMAWLDPKGRPHTTWNSTEALHGWLLSGAVSVLQLRVTSRISPDGEE